MPFEINVREDVQNANAERTAVSNANEKDRQRRRTKRKGEIEYGTQSQWFLDESEVFHES